MARITSLLPIFDTEDEQTAKLDLHRATARGVFIAQPNKELRGRPHLQITTDGKPTAPNAIAIPAALVTDPDAGDTLADRADVAMGESIRAGALASLFGSGDGLRHTAEELDARARMIADDSAATPEEVKEALAALFGGSVTALAERDTEKESPGTLGYFASARKYRDLKNGINAKNIAQMCEEDNATEGQALTKFAKIAHYALTHGAEAREDMGKYDKYEPYVSRVLSELLDYAPKGGGTSVSPKYSPGRIIDRVEEICKELAGDKALIAPPPPPPSDEEGEEEENENDGDGENQSPEDDDADTDGEEDGEENDDQEGEEEEDETPERDKLGNDDQGTNTPDEQEDGDEEEQDGDGDQEEEEGGSSDTPDPDAEGDESEDDGEGDEDGDGASGGDTPSSGSGAPDKDEEGEQKPGEFDPLSELSGMGGMGMSDDETADTDVAEFSWDSEPRTGADSLWRSYRFTTPARVSTDPLPNQYADKDALTLYNQAKARVSPLTSAIREALALLQPNRITRYVGGQRTGQLDQKALHRLFVDQGTPRVFAQKGATQRKKIALVILCDASESMSEKGGGTRSRLDEAKDALTALVEATRDATDVDVAVMSYYTQQQGLSTSNQVPAISHLYGKGSKAEAKPQGIMQYRTCGANCDTHALQYAEKFIQGTFPRERYDHRILVILHDGADCGFLPCKPSLTMTSPGAPDLDGTERYVGKINDLTHAPVSQKIMHGTADRMIADGINVRMYGIYNAYARAYADTLLPEHRAQPTGNAGEAIASIVNMLRRISQT